MKFIQIFSYTILLFFVFFLNAMEDNQVTKLPEEQIIEIPLDNFSKISHKDLAKKLTLLTRGRLDVTVQKTLEPRIKQLQKMDTDEVIFDEESKNILDILEHLSSDKSTAWNLDRRERATINGWVFDAMKQELIKSQSCCPPDWRKVLKEGRRCITSAGIAAFSLYILNMAGCMMWNSQINPD